MLRQLVIIISSVFLAYPATAATLADRHVARNVSCTTCHQKESSTNTQKEGNCLVCHGPYSTLAKKTNRLEINPHDTHLGEISCDSCHSAHDRPKLICTQCHGLSFNKELKTP